MSRLDRKKAKKKGKWKKIGIFVTVALLCLVLSTVGYGYYQYKKGMELAAKNKNSIIVDSPKKIEFKSVDIPNKTNVLLLGVDAHKNGERSRTDSIMILQYTKNHETKLISLMRDSYVSIPGHGNQKLNAAYSFGGVELLRQTIQENFGIGLEYYSIIDFRSFEKMIDVIAPQGITVDVEKSMSSHIGVTLQPGVQQLHGKELLGYARFRHDARGDFDRVARQQKVLNAIKNEVLTVKGITTSVPKTLGLIQPYIQTNFSSFDLVKLGTDFMLRGKNNEIKTLRIPQDNTYVPKRYDNVGEVLELDIEKNREILQSFLN
ncbi:LCP family protein [Bacillus sp. EAC]|uniref:LCP family protein n=1 Tax=Bacillus sp. EAC TaxID=1978338 RepID=UPI000B452C8F|nr:LCP family protein [Bacillus sp. EAC]